MQKNKDQKTTHLMQRPQKPETRKRKDRCLYTHVAQISTPSKLAFRRLGETSSVSNSGKTLKD